MAQSLTVDRNSWDYGQRQPEFKEWSDVVNAYGRGGTAYNAFGRTPTGGGAGAGGSNTSTTGGFWREQLSKNPALSGALETIIGSIGGNTAANQSAVDQFTKAMQAIARQNEGLTSQQMGAANAPFDGSLAANLGKTRSDWATAAGAAADKTNADMTGALNEWNTGQVGRIGSLKDQLSEQLGQSLGKMREQIGSAYGQEQAANAQYGTLRNRLSALAQNRAMNQILARTAPGMGSASSGLDRRVAMRMASDAGAEDALLMNQMNRESLGRKLAGEAGLLETEANLGRTDIQNIGGMGMSQADNYYKQLAATQGADAARRQFIIDQIQGQGAISDIGYVGGQQQAWFGRPQQLLAANAANYLSPVQARQAAIGGDLSLISQGGNALNAANWLAVGTPGNQGGLPRYSMPPVVPDYGSPVPDWGYNLGYAPSERTNPFSAQPERQPVASERTQPVNAFDQWYMGGGMNDIYNAPPVYEPYYGPDYNPNQMIA